MSKKNAISVSDLERAILLIPIVMEMGVEAARRHIVGKSLSDDDLLNLALEFQIDTKTRNENFRRELEEAEKR